MNHIRSGSTAVLQYKERHTIRLSQIEATSHRRVGNKTGTSKMGMILKKNTNQLLLNNILEKMFIRMSHIHKFKLFKEKRLVLTIVRVSF